MRILTKKKYKAILQDLENVYESIDFEEKRNIQGAVATLADAIYLIGGDKALKESGPWKKYMKTLQEKMHEAIEHHILYGEGVDNE